MSDNENKDLENINGEEEQKVTIPSTGEQVDIEDIIDNGVADDLVEGSTDEEKKENKKKLKQQLLISAGIGKNVIDKTLDVVMHESMLPYSEHVILDRALPRVEDGLKPVQRRILYTMYEQNLTPDKPHKKSAKVVGDCLGKYHPHGDSSVYDAMVRLAQDFNLRAPLLDGHGNFGSVDGDSAAAMRYTEIRMAPLALEMLRDLEKNTVPWQWNYDDTLQEPVLLPSRFPNLLVNGASGIAVGLATNIPPHNLAETISGAIAYIDNPDITLDEMMKIIKAPDFPTGGYVIGGEELRQAYATGKGKILIRSKVHIENDNGDKKNIVITEIPYQVNKAKLEQKILELKETKKDILSGINDIVDESDKHGDRIVIKLKKDTDIKKVLNCLFKYTDMQVSYGINMVAIADGRPQQMGLIDILAYYVNFQREVIYKRTKFDLDAAKERQHILQGLIIAVRNIDEVVRIIKTSENVTTAKSRLRERFSLSDKQAQAILDMRLARLTSLEVFKLEQELLELEKRIAELTKILSSKRMQFEIVKEEMGEIRKKFKDGRKSDILASEDEYEVSATETTGAKGPSENVVVCATALGTIKCMSTRHFSQCSKVWSDRSGLQEVIIASIDTMSDKTVLGFSDKGNAYKIDVSLLGDNKFRDKGTPLNKIMPSALPDEKIVYLMESEANLISKDLLFFTECGMIKKTNVSEYQLLKSAYQAIKLKDGDKVIKIEEDKPDTTILFVTKQGIGLNASKDDIPVQGRISAGVKGIALSEGDSVVFVSQISKDDNVILVSNKAFAKKLNVNEIDVLARYRKGVKVFDLKGKDSSGTEILAAGLVKQNTDVVVQTLDEEYKAINSSNIEEDTRASKGKSMSIGNAIILSAFVRTL